MSTGPIPASPPPPPTLLEEGVQRITTVLQGDSVSVICHRDEAREILRRLRHLEQEIREIDATLARRPALDGRPTRRSKIEYLVGAIIALEGKVDPLTEAARRAATFIEQEGDQDESGTSRPEYKRREQEPGYAIIAGDLRGAIA